jgi:hypothetical protein
MVTRAAPGGVTSYIHVHLTLRNLTCLLIRLQVAKEEDVVTLAELFEINIHLKILFKAAYSGINNFKTRPRTFFFQAISPSL